NNSEHGAQSVVHTVNCIRHPAAAASVPAFALQDCVQHRARAELRHHCLKCTSVCFFFQRAFTQEILNVMFVCERAVSLISKFSFVSFLGCFHSTNCDVGAECA